MNEFLELMAQERPVGTEKNSKLIDLIESKLIEMGYKIKSLPFDCHVWRWGLSTIMINNKEFIIEPCPFSKPFTGSGHICTVKTINDLNKVNCQGTILFLSDEITKTPLSPKDYPFYYPDEHKNIINLLEQKQPAAIIAVTGQSVLNGKTPFPFLEDGNFLIPSANISQDTYQSIESLLSIGNQTATLIINSYINIAFSRQIVAQKKSKESRGKIIVGAHMDSKYDTPGALDNATGVAVLLEVAANIDTSIYDIDIVPFNSEEYYGANGELEYLNSLNKNIILMINIDSPCHKNSETAISFYNLDENMQAIVDNVMESSARVIKGKQWYAGDHVPFVVLGTPCLAMTSSDFFDGALEYTHTQKDTLETVDAELVKHSAKYLIEVISQLSAKE